ncbi:hypothetical protein ACFWC9_41325 [Streptomyces goshikiensis]|uniref:DUF3885 domain-containing protein n=1 Tax=Streptomyces goshikiensis TaxID=1942 RepID=UPI0036C207DA
MTELWQRRWPSCPPVGYKLRDPYRDVWVRFHSLPESKRYADDESDYTVVLERYNTVLDELFAGADVYVITPLWTTEAEVPSSQPVTGYWQSLLVEDDPDPEFRTYCHLITDTRMQRIHYPYDGGADVFLATSEERDRMHDRHADWRSSHLSGL